MDPAFAAAFPETSLVALPQGWMRQRGKGGILTPQPWEDADVVLPRVQALVVSHEDVEPFEKDAFEWFQQVPVGAVTHGPDGAILFVNGERYGVEADRVVAVDETGAGDVFAAALLIAYNREGNAWDAAVAAACCAAASVEADGAAGIPDRAGLEARLAAYRRRHGDNRLEQGVQGSAGRAARHRARFPHRRVRRASIPHADAEDSRGDEECLQGVAEATREGCCSRCAQASLMFWRRASPCRSRGPGLHSERADESTWRRGRSGSPRAGSRPTRC